MAKEKGDVRVIKAFVQVVNLSRVYWGRRTNRADRAVRFLRRLIARHTKADKVVILNEVNNYIWRRSREKPPRRIKVLVKVVEEKGGEEEEETVRKAVVLLADEDAKPGPVEISGKKEGGK